MIAKNEKTGPVRCAIYTRKSHEEGLEQAFNSLDAQREACEAYIASQKHEGWKGLATHYDDGGFTGGNMDRPGLKALLVDIEADRVDVVMVYKVDRLSRSLMDFSKLVALFEKHDVAFVSVTQRFDTTSSMGRLTLNILLSFAQFERELCSERIRDKIAIAKKKGKYVGGRPLLGYDVDRERMRLLVNEREARLVRRIFERFCRLGSCMLVARELNRQGHRMKAWTSRKGKPMGGGTWKKTDVHHVLTNRRYLGEVLHKGESYPGEHEAIVDSQALGPRAGHPEREPTRPCQPDAEQDLGHTEGPDPLRVLRCGNGANIHHPARQAVSLLRLPFRRQEGLRHVQSPQRTGRADRAGRLHVSASNLRRPGHGRPYIPGHAGPGRRAAAVAGPSEGPPWRIN